MDIRLLEYNEMKEFYQWAIMKNTYLHYKGKDFAKMGDFEEIRAYDHTNACSKRDEFFRKKFGVFCNKKDMDRCNISCNRCYFYRIWILSIISYEIYTITIG